MLAIFSQLTEFFSRLWLVNVPTYVLVQIPEVSVCATYIMSYVLVQNVGFCWAFLVNASFAIACHVATFLPFQDGMDSYKLVGSFYVVYASVRVITYFASTTGKMAIFCLQNFSGVEKILLMDRIHFFKCYHTLFGVLLILETALVIADPVCLDLLPLGSQVCTYTGLWLITQSRPAYRRLLYGLLSAVVISLWQCVMHQFPKWSRSLSRTSTTAKLSFQVWNAGLAISTVVAVIFLFITMPPGLSYVHDISMCFLLLGWTLSLFRFMPWLVTTSGVDWVNNLSIKSLKRLLLILCMSQGFFVMSYAAYRSLSVGFIGSQLEFVVACFTLPSFWIILIMVVKGISQSSFLLSAVGMPLTLAVSVFLSRVSVVGGDGSGALVFIHFYGKLVQLFGEDIDGDIQEKIEADANPSRYRHNSVIDAMDSDIVTEEDIAQAQIQRLAAALKRQAMSGESGLQTPTANRLSKSNSEPELSTPEARRNRSDSYVFSGKALNERGQANSSLVSVGFPPRIMNHWFVKMCRVTLMAWGRFVRAIAVTDSILSAILRVGIALAASISVVLAAIGVCSVLQRNGNYYFKLLDFQRLDNSTDLKFNHIISNTTLHRMPMNYTTEEVIRPSSPVYSACSMSWGGYRAHDINRLSNGISNSGLSVLDLALLSEVAYIDDESLLYQDTQQILNDLFPNLGMEVVSAPRLNTEGPKFLEVSSSVLKMTVIAVRGTDPGRLYDLLEDVALYSESVSYYLLTLIFPTMRLWSGDTISQTIQWLCDLNRFFGLQPESRYYSPLVQRVRDIEEASAMFHSDRLSCSTDLEDMFCSAEGPDKKKKLLLTGHSLGGGLARIVGMMTGVPSVSFSPPGLSMSFKKYNFLGDNLTPSISISRPGNGVSITQRDIHHESFAVVSEYDWITQVDGQVGMIQKIQCERPDASHKNACHMLEGTICHLLKHCGDHRHRFKGCDFDYDLAPIFPWLINFFSEHKLFLIPIAFIVPIIFMIAIIPDIL